MKRKNLIIKRIEKNLSQKELAQLIGLKNQAISNYENGRSNPSYQSMKRISEALDTSVQKLFFDESW